MTTTTPGPGTLHRVAAHPVTRQLLITAATLFGVAVLVFVLLRVLPGDAITASLGTEAAALTPAQRAALATYYGLDQPLPAQFGSWLGSVLRGDLGTSTRTGRPVLAMTAAALPVTLQLAVLATVFGVALGVGAGLLSASRPDSSRDALGQLVALAGLGIPAFLLGSALLSTAAAWWGINPNAERFAPIWVDPWLNLVQLAMPALVLGLGLAGPVMRTARGALIDVAGQDFVRTARGKGVGPRRIALVHVLRGALVPIVTMTGLQFGYLLGGAVVVEQIFSVPGIGRQVLIGIAQQDYAVVQSTVLVIAATFVLVNLGTDLVYRWVDPRVRAR